MSVQNHQEDDVGQGMLSKQDAACWSKGARFRRGEKGPRIPCIVKNSELFFLGDSSRDLLIP